jgi:hypothetical protein
VKKVSALLKIFSSLKQKKQNWNLWGRPAMMLRVLCLSQGQKITNHTTLIEPKESECKGEVRGQIMVKFE